VHDCTKGDIISVLKRDIENLFAIKDIVIELKTLITMQTEQNKKQDEMLKQQSEAMIKISDTVTHQSQILKRLNQKFDELDLRVQNQKLEDLKDGSVSLNSILKSIIDKALPPILVAGLTYLIIEITSK